MYINFTMETDGARTDVSADERRRIADVFRLLRENGKAEGDSVPAYFRSALLGKLVSANETLAGAGIVDGDLLTT
ncbi:MAG: EsaB/YukD family protein [Clostridiales bacterium]|nr:EsaB/YukD family protein [Clostridiales bacterium]